MRIAVFASYFYPHKGGVENYVYEIYSRLVKKDIKVDIITCNTNNSQTEEIINGLKIYRFDCWDALGKTYPIPKINKKFFQIIKKLDKNSYSFVNTQTRFFILSFIGFLYGKLKGIKVIHTEHGTRHSFSSNSIVNALSWVYDHTIGYVVTRFADYNIAISKASGEFSKHLGARNYEIVYNGVDTNKFRRRETDLRKRLNIDPEYKIITFVGRLIEAKGAQDLIEAFKIVKDKVRVKLLIVGNGNYKNQLIELADGDGDIIFFGEKNEEEIIDVLSITDVFVNPSYSEGLPTSVLEAAACGCAIIATDVGGTKEIEREINQDNKSFFLYKVGNAIQFEDYLLSILKRDNLTSNQYLSLMPTHSISIFSWDIIAGKYCKLLKSI